MGHVKYFPKDNTEKVRSKWQVLNAKMRCGRTEFFNYFTADLKDKTAGRGNPGRNCSDAEGHMCACHANEQSELAKSIEQSSKTWEAGGWLVGMVGFTFVLNVVYDSYRKFFCVGTSLMNSTVAALASMWACAAAGKVVGAAIGAASYGIKKFKKQRDALQWARHRWAVLSAPHSPSPEPWFTGDGPDERAVVRANIRKELGRQMKRTAMFDALRGMAFGFGFFGLDALITIGWAYGKSASALSPSFAAAYATLSALAGAAIGALVGMGVSVVSNIMKNKRIIENKENELFPSIYCD